MLSDKVIFVAVAQFVMQQKSVYLIMVLCSSAVSKTNVIYTVSLKLPKGMQDNFVQHGHFTV